MENQHQQYVCPKCGCTEFEHDQFQATGGNFAISCAQCGYTELYRAASSDGWNILDFLTNG